MSSRSDLYAAMLNIAKDAQQLNTELIKNAMENSDVLAKEMANQAMPTAALEAAIKNRLENGFKNWNGGYDGWLTWCNTLYEPDAHYNVYGKRLTLQEY